MNKLIPAALASILVAGTAVAQPTTFARGDLMQSSYVGR